MNTQETNSNHFILKGLSSILIGGFILGGTYVIQSIIEDTTIDTSIKSALIIIPFIVFLLSSCTLYFSGRKVAKKTQNKLWNAKTKIVFKKYSIGFCVISLVLVFLFYKELNYPTPIFLIFYGILLFLLKNKKRKDFLILSGVSLLLGLLCLLIPSYWQSSLYILGIAHITYGVVVND